MEIFDWIRNGDITLLKSAIAAGADPNSRDNSGDTLLIVAAGLGAIEFVDALLMAGADIELTNQYEFVALSHALWCNQVSVARHLVARGAAVSIDCAAALGDLKRLRREWRSMPTIDVTIGACRTGQTEVARWFLGRGTPVDLHPPGHEWGGIGCPGLHHAALNDDVDVAQLLLEHGSDLNLVDDVHGSQALAWADSAGQEGVVSVLLDAGADPAHQNTHGITAADLARANGFEQLAEHLGPRKK